MGSNAMKTYKSLGCYLTCTVFVNNIPHTLRQSNIYIALFFQFACQNILIGKILNPKVSPMHPSECFCANVR